MNARTGIYWTTTTLIALAFLSAAHGTLDQRSRLDAGVLLMEEAIEVIEAITDHAFGPLGDRRRYVHNGVDMLQAHLRANP